MDVVMLAVLLCAGCSGPAGEAEKASETRRRGWRRARPRLPPRRAIASAWRSTRGDVRRRASKAFSRTFGGEFHCYRTYGDGLGKVTEFFKANTSLTPDGIGDKDARFLHRTDPVVLPDHEVHVDVAGHVRREARRHLSDQIVCRDEEEDVSVISL